VIGENIKAARKAKGLSQEEVAARLGVVRQTVSKWEKGLSVPDADLLVQMARLLEVPVDDLLDVETLPQEEEKQRSHPAQTSQKRGLLLFLSFAAMLVMLAVKSEAVSILLSGTCLVVALVILYRNMEPLSAPLADEKLRPLRIVTLFDSALLVLVMGTVFLSRTFFPGILPENGQLPAMGIIIVGMIFCGLISPKLPFNRHTGLRLPWTVQDEEAWAVAHRALGQISLPLALLYLAAGLTVPYFEAVTLAAIILWVGIPGGLSFLCFWRKFHKK